MPKGGKRTPQGGRPLGSTKPVRENIIDLALPFVIEKGLNTKDEIGFFLMDREPFILAGKPPSWIKYEPRCF